MVVIGVVSGVVEEGEVELVVEPATAERFCCNGFSEVVMSCSVLERELCLDTTAESEFVAMVLRDISLCSGVSPCEISSLSPVTFSAWLGSSNRSRFSLALD